MGSYPTILENLQKYSAKVKETFSKWPVKLLREKNRLMKKTRKIVDANDAKIKDFRRGVTLTYKLDNNSLRVHAGIIVRRHNYTVTLFSLESPQVHLITIEQHWEDWNNYLEKRAQTRLKRLKTVWKRHLRLKMFMEKMDEWIRQQKNSRFHPGHSFKNEIGNNYIAMCGLNEGEAKKAKKYLKDIEGAERSIFSNSGGGT